MTILEVVHSLNRTTLIYSFCQFIMEGGVPPIELFLLLFIAIYSYLLLSIVIDSHKTSNLFRLELVLQFIDLLVPVLDLLLQPCVFFLHCLNHFFLWSHSLFHIFVTFYQLLNTVMRIYFRPYEWKSAFLTFYYLEQAFVLQMLVQVLFLEPWPARRIVPALYLVLTAVEVQVMVHHPPRNFIIT